MTLIDRRADQDRRELVREFVEHWQALSGDAWIALDGVEAVRRAVVAAAMAMVPPPEPGLPRRVVVWQTHELDALCLPEILAPQGFEFSTRTASNAEDEAADADAVAVHQRSAASADLGITSCAWAAADTGTIALYASPSTGRLTSLLPTAHLALVRPSLIVRTIPDGLALLAEYAAQAGGLPSTVNLASGPSRTGDIEGDLAVGAHGPVRAGVIIGDW